MFKIKKKIIPYRKLYKKAENIFHKYIVLRDKGICFTCDNPGNQAGHLFHNRLDFQGLNLHCQCLHCNDDLSGNLGEYKIRFIKKYGLKCYEDLKLEANQSKKYTRIELEAIIDFSKRKIKELEKEL